VTPVRVLPRNVMSSPVTTVTTFCLAPSPTVTNSQHLNIQAIGPTWADDSVHHPQLRRSARVRPQVAWGLCCLPAPWSPWM
jgi:hypothetical protein